jgi:hypothetical protein
MTEEKKDRREDLLDLGVPVDSPEEPQDEDEFGVYRSLGYLSTGDVIQSTGFTKNELFYLLSTGFPIIKPIRIPLQGLGKELNAYLFSDRDLYILTLVKRLKEKYSLQQIRGMFSKLEYYSFIKDKLHSFDDSLGGLTPGEEFWKEREELIEKSSIEHYFAKTNNEELSKQLGKKAANEWKFLESNISEIVQKIIEGGGEKLIEDLGLRIQNTEELDSEFPF